MRVVGKLGRGISQGESDLADKMGRAESLLILLAFSALLVGGFWEPGFPAWAAIIAGIGTGWCVGTELLDLAAEKWGPPQ